MMWPNFKTRRYHTRMTMNHLCALLHLWQRNIHHFWLFYFRVDVLGIAWQQKVMPSTSLFLRFLLGHSQNFAILLNAHKILNAAVRRQQLTLWQPGIEYPSTSSSSSSSSSSRSSSSSSSSSSRSRSRSSRHVTEKPEISWNHRHLYILSFYGTFMRPLHWKQSQLWVLSLKFDVVCVLSSSLTSCCIGLFIDSMWSGIYIYIIHIYIIICNQHTYTIWSSTGWTDHSLALRGNKKQTYLAPWLVSLQFHHPWQCLFGISMN